LLQTQIGQHSLGEWDKLWEPLPDAFKKQHPELWRVPGLFRIVRNGETKYICSALEIAGGIAKGLRRISGPPQTGNKGFGAQKIREHIDQVRVEILRLDKEQNPMKTGRLLKRSMVKLHSPEWGKPAQQRMDEIRSGKRPASR
jgi:hypothetical protein